MESSEGRTSRTGRPPSLGLRRRCLAPALALALLIAVPGLAQPPPPPIYPHPDPASGRAFFPLAQAYRLVPRGNPLFVGERQVRKVFGAVEGVLDLATRTVGPSVVLDSAAFATCRAGVETSPVVVGAKLIKTIPGSALYPSVYAPQTFTQLDMNIRTHWALAYDQPGTTFVLEVTVRCTTLAGGALVEHIDRYTWQVVATVDSLRALLDALHTHPLGTSGLPLITSEAEFRSLQAGLDQIEAG